MIESKLASGAIVAGKAVYQTANPNLPENGEVTALAASPALTADDDALAAAFASVASATDVDLDSAVLTPSRRITFILDGANWNAGNLIVRGYNAAGEPITESLAITDDPSSATFTTVQAFAKVGVVTKPAGAGTAGTGTVGVAAADESSALGRFNLAGVALYDAMHEQGSSTAEFADGDSLGCVRKGAVYVETEDACTQANLVYCRITTSGSEVAGSFRSDSDSGDAFVVHGARFKRESAVAEINVLELDL